MAKQKTDGEADGLVTSKFGTADASKNRDAGTFTADRRLYLDADGRVVEHDDPGKVELLAPAGGTIPMKRARELGLFGDADGGHTVASTAADGPEAEAEADEPRAASTARADKAEADKAEADKARAPKPSK